MFPEQPQCGAAPVPQVHDTLAQLIVPQEPKARLALGIQPRLQLEQHLLSGFSSLLF